MLCEYEHFCLVITYIILNIDTFYQLTKKKKNSNNFTINQLMTCKKCFSICDILKYFYIQRKLNKNKYIQKYTNSI